jgi:hypothetical protein
LATVNVTGLVAAVRAGELQINARFEDTSGVLRITVVGTPSVPTVPWSQLPSLSSEARSFITSSNLNWAYGGGAAGAVKRWNSFPISIRADRNIDSSDVEEAVNFWQSITNRKITFRLVPFSAEASLVLSLQWPPPNNIMVSERTCAVGGPTTIQNNVIVSGGAYFDKARSNCGLSAPILAHEIGHTLGILGHTTSDTDVMNSSGPVLRASPLVSEVFNWLYSVEPGIRPQ